VRPLRTASAADSLPDAITTPACWRWVTDRQTPDGLRAQSATSTDPQSHVLPEHHIAFELLRLWHDGRCVVCGVTAANRLVRNRDHATGLLRGLLCSACNTAEGRSDSPLFANYRRRPPVDLLSVEVLAVVADAGVDHDRAPGCPSTQVWAAPVGPR
jgi:Recombination endonuclease VII